MFPPTLKRFIAETVGRLAEEPDCIEFEMVLGEEAWPPLIIVTEDLAGPPLVLNFAIPLGFPRVADLGDPDDFRLGQRGREETVGPLDVRILLFCDLITGVIVTLYSLRGLGLADCIVT